MLTLGILLIGGLTAYIFLGQANIMQGQLEEMRGAGQQTERLIILNTGQLIQTERQATKLGDQVRQFSRVATASEKANKITQDNAQRALQTSIDNSRLDERPWVSTSRYLLSQEPTGDNELKISIWMNNSGKTPALNVSQWSKVSMWEGEPPVFSIKDVPIENKFFSRSILPPGLTDSHFVTDPFKALQTQMTPYKSGQFRIYVQAAIRYTDSVNKSHWTTICISHGFGDPPDEFMYCNQGNDMDGEN